MILNSLVQPSPTLTSTGCTCFNGCRGTEFTACMCPAKSEASLRGRARSREYAPCDVSDDERELDSLLVRPGRWYVAPSGS